ncbi:MAG: lytic transglycosylase domain-containing protein [Armatimonadota bacterium]
MRPVLRVSLAALLLGASAAAWSSPYKLADAYFELRDRAQVVVDFSEGEVQTQPQQFEGKLLEVRGLISAVVDSGSQLTLLIQPPAPGSPAMTVLVNSEKKPAGTEFLDVRNTIRALCRVVTLEGSASGALELVRVVKEHEAAAIDQSRQSAREAAEAKRAAEARKQALQRQQPLTSRHSVGSAVRQAPVRPKAAPQAPGRTYTRHELVDVYGNAVRYFNRRLSVPESKEIAGIILEYSDRYGLDPRLVMAVIAVESNFNAGAVSHAGAQGLGQLMPGTAGDLGVANPFDKRSNLEGSTRLLSRHIQNMSKDGKPTEEAIRLALACYNAGAGAVKKYKGIPPYRETQNYVKKITRLYRQMCGYEN